MPDPAPAEVRSAGAVLWRPGPAGLEVAVIHRERYDDWSFPKGKREPGEHPVATAVREVAEETGVQVTLGRPLGQSSYSSGGQPKLVDYWVASPADPGHIPDFTPNDEVDKLEWLPLPAAQDRLSYERDVRMLERFASGPAVTVPFILLRHASAGRKSDWPDQDLARPLDAHGATDADRIAPLLAAFGHSRVISSAAERCVATVRPYAALTGMAIEVDALFTARPVSGVTPEQVARTGELAGEGRPAIICAHRENLPALLTALSSRLGAPPPAGRPLRKAAWWVLHTAAGQLVAAERHRPIR
jgi:8-oxo-dGTP pyrophosphatase MutT (NUDIX family)/phosphohistidine phosphatase SixA